MLDLRFKLSQNVFLKNGLQIHFSDWMMKKIVRMQKSSLSNDENGGILLGVIQKDNLILIFGTEAFKKDKRRRMGFERRDDKHLKVWRYFVDKTKGRIGYLGEWHTHPEKNPSPSGIDLTEWRKVEKKLGTPLIFMIIGEESIYLRAFV